jgi:REP element-mobilizing transposase RayT
MASAQATFGFMRRGGRRRGSGRKPKILGRPGVAHTPRPTLSGREPVHVTLRLAAEVPNLRRNALHAVIFEALRAGNAKSGFRLCHFSVLGNHLHLLVEAASARDLARGMQGLSSRLARRVNQALGRRGRFFGDRYHAHVLRTPSEVHRALVYVLLNQRKHEAARSAYVPPPAVDAWSSGAWFGRWAVEPYNAARLRRANAPPVVEPTTWLLREGWRKAGTVAIA